VKPYRFLEEADAEFREQIAYFDEQTAGLGDRFVADVESTVSNIREYPESGSLLSGKVRKRVLRVFKYNILYVKAGGNPHRGHCASQASPSLLEETPPNATLNTAKGVRYSPSRRNRPAYLSMIF
jgi:hypothetical protein